jgi:O-antigen ligase
VCAAVAVAWRGGYPDAARGTFTVLAGVTFLVAHDRHPARARAGLRTPAAALLLALAALGALSTLWTVGARDDALRWAAVLAGLAVLIAAAAALPAPRPHAAILLGVGVLATAVGVVGAIVHADRIALDICGAWRPAGPFEYSPALALAGVFALPAALQGMLGARQPGAFAATGWLLTTAVLVSGSRTAALLAPAALMWCAATLPAGVRRRAGGAAALLLATGGLAALALGGELGDDGAAGLLVAAACGAAAALLAARVPAPRFALAQAAVVGGACVAGVSADERAGGCAGSGLAHGRSGIWAAAIRTAEDRPLAGHGLESFLAASRTEQLQERPIPVQYAHNLPLEAWVELGIAGAVLTLALLVAVGAAALTAAGAARALLAPAAVGFLAANLLDWTWHLAGAAALWAIAVGGLLAGTLPSRE